MRPKKKDIDLTMSLEDVLLAASFAAAAHAAQKRKFSGAPYINHLLRVGEAAARASLSTEAVMAALLHDTVEDTPTTFDDLARSFSPRTVLLVKLLTKWWPDGAPPDTVRADKAEYYRRILEDGEATSLKLLDRADNLTDAATTLPASVAWSTSYLRRTELECGDLATKSNNTVAKQAYIDALEHLRQALARQTSGQT